MKIVDSLTAKPARFFLLAALLWFGLMCFLNSKDVGENGFSWHDILVEANGMVFDLLVFGILLSIYDALREKKGKVERLHEEIDDYRGWDEKEAMHRIVGAINRLNKLGEFQLQLNKCFLEGGQLVKANLKGANLAWANLKGANLREANLEGTNLEGTNFQGSNLSGANLKGANLAWADLQGAGLSKSDLTGANLTNIKVRTDWFEMIEAIKVKGHEEIITKYFLDEEGRLKERES